MLSRLDDTHAENFVTGRANDVCIVGGAGHIGAPLAIVLAHRGMNVVIHDLNGAAMDTLASGQMPFFEENAEPMLREVLAAKRLAFSKDPASVAGTKYVIVAIGTLVDEFHNPMLRLVQECIETLLPHLSDDQTLVLRSTVFPGVTEYVQRYLSAHGKRTLVAFCPERTVQGFSIREIQSLAQIVSGTTREAEDSAARLFESVAPKIVRMVPKEAEYAKLISNAYRYIQFAATNQFYMMVESEGLDYHRLLSGLKDGYPRMNDLPRPGLAAGPCLYKDTLQLAAASAAHPFRLGHEAIQVNEGLPAFIVGQLAKRHPLHEMTVGLLGMAFKADSDDTRASLSYKLKRILKHEAKAVLTTDPFVKTDRELLPLDEVIARSDALVLAVPHTAYRGLDAGEKPIVDIWNVAKKS